MRKNGKDHGGKESVNTVKEFEGNMKGNVVSLPPLNYYHVLLCILLIVL